MSEQHLEYLIVFETGENNYSAYLPDVPGCVATGRTREEVERNIREALEAHLAGMREDGEPLPRPAAWVETVEVLT